MQNRRSGSSSLTGKIAIVTGGSGLLGRQHCLALLELGAVVFNFDIAPIDLSRDLEFANHSLTFKSIACDLTLEDDVEAKVSEVLSEVKSIDILINNASIDHKIPSNLSTNTFDYRFENFDLSSWEHELGVGLNGAIYCSKYVARNMIANRSGVIINVASDLGVIAPDHRIYVKRDASREDIQYFKPFSYSVIKHGLIGLTKYLATYLAEFEIRVNSISPGSIFNHQDEEFVENLESLIPLGRMARVDEYKAAIQFLSSDASSYMTGQNLIMDGGRSSW